ncbi:cell adhesion molecule 2-like [Engraulis encrasicolus]|uniref:cell adhesion molecule 2-like n=1 Tax=Engraulis encrasicolus TaxID=184585 RepID=UPI002FD2B3A5
MMVKQHMFLTLCSLLGIALKGAQGQFPLVQNVTVLEGSVALMTCRVENNDDTSLQWGNPAQQTLYFGDKKALRDSRINLVRATYHELTISISEVTLHDEGEYTCSLFTYPIRTAKAYLTVHRVPDEPQILGLNKPVMEGDEVTMTCESSGSKPAADIRWFRNGQEISEIKSLKEVDLSGKTYTVRSSLKMQVNQDDDGISYTCQVDHVSLATQPHLATEVLQVQYAPRVEIKYSQPFPQEGGLLKLECVSRGNPVPDPVLWTKDGGELPDLERMIVEGAELTFIALNKTDNGTYRCEASNNLGTDHDEYKLFVYDPNALGPHNTDHALIGGVVAVVAFVTLCLIIVLGRYFARHKGTYLTNEAKGADDAPDADTAIINAEGNHASEEKKEYFI